MRVRKAEDGAAAVEFALVIPLLLFMLFALLDFGWIFNQQLALSSAAREAARFYAIHWDDDAATLPADAEARASGFVETTVSFDWTGANCTGEDGDEVTVILSTPIDDITGLIAGLFGETPLQAKGTMRCSG